MYLGVFIFVNNFLFLFYLQVFGCNVIGTVVIISWALFWSVSIFSFLKWTGMMRIPVEIELNGLDWPKHHEYSHDISAWSDDFRSPLLDNETRDNNWVGQNYKAANSQAEATHISTFKTFFVIFERKIIQNFLFQSNEFGNHLHTQEEWLKIIFNIRNYFD